MSNTLYYEYENEASIDNNLKCAICNDAFIGPVGTPCQIWRSTGFNAISTAISG
jgi:hypothetical protein